VRFGEVRLRQKPVDPLKTEKSKKKEVEADVNFANGLEAAFRRDKGDMAVRILLVDDHPIVRQGLRTLLEGRPGWEVVGEASDGYEALEKVTSLQPDVVVLDVTMPRMNGLEACRSIQKRKNDGLEVLFVTQHDSPQMMREALDAGARGYVVKSNAARDLLEAVEAVSQHRVFTALAKSIQATS
jgi:DNA-binding NarL/FixJ family response regulator